MHAVGISWFVCIALVGLEGTGWQDSDKHVRLGLMLFQPQAAECVSHAERFIYTHTHTHTHNESLQHMVHVLHHECVAQYIYGSALLNVDGVHSQPLQ